MKKIRRRVQLVAVGALLSMATLACGNNSDIAGSRLSGTVSGDGSSTVFPITEAVAEEFQKENPNVQVTVGVSGTGGGFKRFCNDETDIQDASRPIKASELEACKVKGVEYIELTVANDGLAVVANKANAWADCLTTEELEKIWAPESAIKDWRDVRTGFPTKELKLYGPGQDSGTFDFFTEKINGQEGESRSDYTASEDDNTLVQGVEGDDGALGYFGFAYYSANRSKLKLLGVDSGSGCVKPSDETVKAGTYAPLSRPLFLYVKKSSIARPEVRAFIDFYLDIVNEILSDVGYTPLADQVLTDQKDEFDRAAGGS